MATDGEDFDVEAPPPDRPTPSDPSPRPARSAVGFFVFGLVLVAAGIVIAPTSPTITDRWIVPDLEAPPQQLWEAPLSSALASSGQVWIGSDEVVAASSNSVHGLDLATGERQWEVRAPQLQCGRDGEDIACVSRQGARSELIELTMGDGEVARTVHTDLVAAQPHDDGLITVFEQSGALTAARWGSSQEHLWDHRIEVEPTADGPAEDLVHLSLGTVDDLVLISANFAPSGEGPHVALDLDTGEPEPDVQIVTSFQGEWLVEREEGITVYDPSGQPWWAGSTGVMRVDDDPGTQLQVEAASDELLTGATPDESPLWEFAVDQGEYIFPFARLAGTVVAVSSSALYGLDAEDGSELWRRPAVPGQQSFFVSRCPCLGAGDVLALVTGDEESVLTGLDITTGEDIWQVEISPDRAFGFGTDGRHLGIFTQHGLSMWSLEQP